MKYRQINFKNTCNRFHFSTNIQFDVQSAFACSKLTIETLEQGLKYIQS